jgi:pyruvate dehydrogenase E2 component (dihydrolipoamide acetyltransferase)
MPKSGYTMTEGKVVSIKVKVGDSVKKGDVLMEYETEKMVGEVISTAAGVVLEIYVALGDSVEVQGKLCLIGKQGESAPREVPGGKTAPQGPEQASPAGVPVAPPGGGRIPASPIAKKLAAEGGLDLALIKGSGPGGRIEKKDVEAAIAEKENIKATPAAVKIAAEKGIGPDAVKGSGYNGRVYAEDLETPGTELPERSIEYYLEGTSEPMTAMRKVIARRMTASKREVPHVYYRLEVDVSAVQNMKKTFAEASAKKYGIKLSINDIVLKAAVQALTEYPGVNARVDGNNIFYYKHVNIGMAVGIEGGLMVPVIHGAETRSVYEISKAASVLAKKAREGLLKGDDCAGGTFTVSNLGMFGLDEFCAVINQPEAAILAVGAIKEKVVWKNGACAPAESMVLTLSADHCLVDGTLAARFMKRLGEILENALILMI